MENSKGLSVYRSSAGSGKTYTLVKEYLKLALENPERFRHILAITFTNKASEEMKSRIIKALAQFTGGKKDAMQIDICNKLKISDEIFRQRATILLSAILHRYSDFKVCTIDSFFNKIIHSLAKEFQIPLRFDTEIETDLVLDEIIEKILMKAGKDSRLTAWLEEFIFSKMEDEKGWRIDFEIRKIAKEFFKDTFRKSFESGNRITADFISELKKIRYAFENRLETWGKEFFEILQQHHLDIADLAQKEKGIAGFFKKLVEKDFYNLTFGKRYNDALESPEAWTTRSSEKRDAIIWLAESQFQPLLKKVDDYYFKNESSWATAMEVLKLIYVAGIAFNLDEELKNYRDENEILLISDTNLLLKKFISGNDTPFIYEKTGNTIHHILLDEFQDTSILQWDNLLPLAANSVASGNKVMAVGDAKQSIYRWRGGEMDLLLHGIEHDLKNISPVADFNVLDKNFRSRKEIVEFNNSFFRVSAEQLNEKLIANASPRSFPAAYNAGEIEQSLHENSKDGGYVEGIIFKNAPEETESSIQDEIRTKKDIALELMTRKILQALQNGFDEKDIAILVRNNSEGALAANHLFENGFTKIISPESLLISSSPEIIFLVNLIRFLENPGYVIPRAECLYYYQHVLLKNTEDIHHLFFHATDLSDFLNRMPEQFRKQLDYLRCIPLYETCEQLIQIFRLNQPADVYVQRFLDAAIEFSTEFPGSKSKFIEWWETEKDNISVIVPEGENAIRILTIHKSKGLEFPVVIIPFADWTLKPKSNELFWVHSNVSPYNEYDSLPVNFSSRLEKTIFSEQYVIECEHTLIDNLNLLYVAFTRAAVQLYFFCPQDDKYESLTKTSHLIRASLSGDEYFKTNLKESAEAIIFSTGIPPAPLKPINPENASGSAIVFNESSTLNAFNSSEWKHRVSLAVNKNKISVGDEDLAKEKSETGNLFHQLISKIISEKDAGPVLQKLYDDAFLKEDEKNKLSGWITSVFEICRNKGWIAGKYEVRTESELLLPDASMLRPDRVMIHHNHVIILDFKTGEENPGHVKQIKKYADQLLSAGYKSAEAYLLYLEPLKLEKIL